MVSVRQLGLLLVVVTLVLPGVAATANNSTSASPNATSPSQMVTQIDSHGYVKSAHWEDGVMYMVIVSDTYRSATISGNRDPDTGRFDIHDVQFYKGTTNVSVRAPKDDGQAVASIVTNGCKQARSCPTVDVGEDTSGSWLRNPEVSDVVASVGVVVLLVVVTLPLASWALDRYRGGERVVF